LKQCLTFKGNRKRYSTALRKITSTMLLTLRRKDGIAVYIPKRVFWRRWQPKLS
jgi:hypothetical protein